MKPSIVDEAIVDQRGVPHIVVNRATQQGANCHGWLYTLRARPKPTTNCDFSYATLLEDSIVIAIVVK